MYVAVQFGVNGKNKKWAEVYELNLRFPSNKQKKNWENLILSSDVGKITNI